MYYFILDGETSFQNGIVVTKRPDFPSPERNYNVYDIPGRDGQLYEDLGTYNDIEIEIECNFIDNPNRWHEHWRKVKKWLLKSGTRRFQNCDDPDFYYVVKKIVIGTAEREIVQSAEFTITLTVDPWTYLVNGLNKYAPSMVLDNAYSLAKPIYYITGEGMCTLTVNGNAVTANVGQNLTIDTYREICYRTDGTLQNTAINADYDKMFLIPGTNTITVSSGFTCNIQPNWRVI